MLPSHRPRSRLIAALVVLYIVLGSPIAESEQSKNWPRFFYAKGIFARYDVDTGERRFRARIAPGAAAFTASPWAYDGKIFAMSEEGTTFVIEAGKEYRLVGVNMLDEWSMASPAMVGERLLIRTESRLYSIKSATPTP